MKLRQIYFYVTYLLYHFDIYIYVPLTVLCFTSVLLGYSHISYPILLHDTLHADATLVIFLIIHHSFFLLDLHATWAPFY